MISPTFENKPLILVADDDRTVRLMLRRTLERADYRVIEAGNGQEALDSFLEHKPDIVLMDVMMPVMDGFEACTKLQSLPDGQLIPVLMITGLDDDSSVEQAFSAGATDYITKPIHWAVLRQRVQRLLRVRKAEKALRANEGRLRAITSSLGEGVFVLDREGQFTFMNPEAERLLGYSLENKQNLSINGIVAHQYPQHSAIVKECLLTSAVLAGETIRLEETFFVRKDGEIFPASLVSAPLYVEETISGSVNVFQDITQRKKWEDKLRLAAKVFESTSEGILVTDVQGNIQSANRAFTQQTGYSEEEILGKRPRIFRSGLHTSEFYELMWQSLLQKGYWEGEIWNKRKNGQTLPQWLTIQAIKNDHGNTTHYAAVFKDITADVQMRKDVALAGQIQKNSLPQNLDNEFLLLEGLYYPHQYVSGDFYDYCWNSQEKVLFGFLMDVMGHGLSTAIQASALRVLFHQAAEMKEPLSHRLAWLNREAMAYCADGSFAAAIIFELDFKQHVLQCSSAGINYFIHLKGKRRKLVRHTGLYLGITEDAVFDDFSTHFSSGDSFFFASDGFYDLIKDKKEETSSSFEKTAAFFRSLAEEGLCTDDSSAVGLLIK